MMTSRSCGGVARAGPRRATSDLSSCRSTRHSTSSPPRASSGSVLNLQGVTKCANSSLEPVPKCAGKVSGSLDDLVGLEEQRVRHGEAERPSGAEVEDKLEPGRLIDRY